MTGGKETPATVTEGPGAGAADAGPSKRRLHVSGLVENVTEEDVRNRFKSFGEVNGVELVRTATGACRGFCYVEVTGTDREYTRCLNTLQHTKWKGKTLNIAPAKISFVNRLKTEIEEIKAEASNPPPVVEASVPKGPPTPKEARTLKGWKTGKMGRVYATVHMVDPRTRKLIKYDPSTANHIKRFRDDADIPSTGSEISKEIKVKTAGVKATQEKRLDMKELDQAQKIAESIAAKKDGKTVGAKTEIPEEANSADEGKEKKTGKRKVKMEEEEGTEEETKQPKKGKVVSVPNDLFGAPTKQPAEMKEGRVSFPTVSIIDEFRSAMAAAPQIPPEISVQVVPTEEEARPKDSFTFGFAASDDEIDESPAKPAAESGKSGVKSGIVDMDEPDLPPPKRQKVVVEEDGELDSEPEFEIQKPVLVVAEKTEAKVEKKIESDEQPPKTPRKETEKSELKNKEKAEKGDKKKKEKEVEEERIENMTKSEIVEEKKGAKKQKVGTKERESETEKGKSTKNEQEKPPKKIKEKKAKADENETPTEPTTVAPKSEKETVNEKEEKKKKKEKAAEALKTKEELKALANQKRLESIQQRNALTAQRQALKINPEKPTKKKIVFDDDGNAVMEGADSGHVDNNAPAKSSAQQSSGDEERESGEESSSEGEGEERREVKRRSKGEASWLGSESEGEEKEADWSIKPVFEGKQGPRMLSMQSRYKGDERFKLTESFVDSESDSGSEDVEGRGDGGEEDEMDEGDKEEQMKRQLQKEKEAQLQILKGMVPKRERQLIDKKMAESSEDETGRKKGQFVDVNKMHYDPTKADAGQFEIDRSEELAKKRAAKQAAKEAAEAAATASVTPMPEVSSERFVKVNLKTMSSLFKRPGAEPAPEAEGSFSLLGGDDEPPAEEGFSLFGALGDDDLDMEEDDDGNAASEHEESPLETIHSQSEKSDGKEGKRVPESTVITTAAPTVAGAAVAGREVAAKRLFFFHLSTPELANRLVEKKETEHGPVFEFKPFFVRNGSLEEVEERWRQERANLTHQFKTKHKTSVRRLKKLRQVRPKAT